MTGAKAADTKEEERTVKFASMLAQLHGGCQHVLFLELGSGATLCPSALHLIRNAVSRADSFWSHAALIILLFCLSLTYS